MSQDRATILVVDDNALERSALSGMLRAGPLHAHVLEASTGAETLSLARQKPDLIVLDVNLPDISGLEVCRQLKSDAETAPIPVIHLSGTAMESRDRILGLQTGADAYLVQPLEPPELIATLQAWLRVRRAEQEREEVLRRAEQARAEADKWKIDEAMIAAGRLAAALAHEINNPLAALTNAMFLLKRSESLSQQDRSYLMICEESVHRVTRIARQILTLYGGGGAAARVNISELLDTVVSGLAAKLKDAGITVVKRYRCRASISGNSAELQQVLSGLLQNAAEAVERGGHIRLDVFSANNWKWAGQQGVRIVIADDGRGISPDNRSRLFEPFFSTKQEKASGLGLWIAREVVQRHGGNIRIRSRADERGHGTVVSMYLPLELPHKRPQATARPVTTPKIAAN